MLADSTINTVGYYCGRFSPGAFGEPLNSLSNVAFVAGAWFALIVWRRNADRDPWQLVLFALAAAIGVGSFTFHTWPTPTTLLVDLVPIQIFGIAFVSYACVRYLHARVLVMFTFAVCFFFARQYWIVLTQRAGLGGGITHVPSLAVLTAVGVLLHVKRLRIGRYVLLACAAYASALLVRSFDLPFCSRFPIGVHWIWHLLTALTTSLLLYAVARLPPNPSIEEMASGQGLSAVPHVKP